MLHSKSDQTEFIGQCGLGATTPLIAVEALRAPDFL